MTSFTDTHCHIHASDYPLGADEALQRARAAGVGRLICVGTDDETSRQAAEFVQTRPDVWASVALHPHDAVRGASAIQTLEWLLQNYEKIVAVGECGLDYYYDHSPHDQQQAMLRAQIELAQRYDKPLIFHVREAFDDFWPIFDSYSGLRGVIHSFTDSAENLHRALDRGLFIGVNGIATFTKEPLQTEVYRSIPLEKLLLETDAPFLTPVPMRGKINEPAFVTHVAHYIANLQSINLTELSRATEQNATNLFLK